VAIFRKGKKQEVSGKEMTTHAIERLKERYGKDLSAADISKICSSLKKGRYLVLPDFKTTDKIKILIKYNDIPLKLVYSKSTNRIITALPLDVDEYNDYYGLVPELGTAAKYIDFNSEMKDLLDEFYSKFEDKKFYHYLDIIKEITKGTPLNIEEVSEHFVIVWIEKEDDCIVNEIFSKNSLKRRLRQNIIDLLAKDEIDSIRKILDFYEKL